MRICIKSFGCSTNLADGEALAGCLAESGYDISQRASEADLVIFNTCAVKGPTEIRMINVLKHVPLNKKVIVAGCLPLINLARLRNEVRFDGIAGPAACERIVEVVERVLKGEKVVALRDCLEAKPSLRLPRLRRNPIVSIIPVNYGCLGSCAYCCVVFARGRLRSYSIEEIVERVEEDLTHSAREFWITSQDSASYGRDRGLNLAELLNAVCDIKGDFRIRVGMMTPNVVMDILGELIQAYRHEKVFKFVHLPVQSGDEQVLEKMRRFYSIAEFRKIVDAFRADFSDVTLSTDIICGFPGEDEEAFKETLKLIEIVKPDTVNISRFFARPGTLAARMTSGFVPGFEIKRRSLVATDLVRKVASERNQRWVGWDGEVLVDEVGKVQGSWVGRNFAYKPIALKSNENLLGKTLNVRVVRAYSTYLEGELIG
jgi:MiaB-like tRNA modifying enzyme